MQRKTAVAYHPNFLLHVAGPSHPESPDRLISVINHLKDSFKRHELVWLNIKPASRSVIEKNHDSKYIETVDSFSLLNSLKQIDNDTIAGPLTGHAAYLSVGGIIEAIDFVMNQTNANAFCAVRPPGHHAESSHAMGFCFFNTVAIGAHYAIEKYSLDRIAIIDWDVHHGNGTQNSFYESSQVFYLSLHEHPLFPGTGLGSEIGENRGIGSTLNLPLASGTGDSQYRQIFNQEAIPKLREFEPELILISAGFDAHIMDPLSSLKISTPYFGEITNKLIKIADEFCKGRIVSCLEGGYNVEALTNSVACHVSALR
ncbi:MAG: histone deacetylase [Candidatus Latescibacterota bacterium]|nr:histone deacetylase [Candidatus Latescibacterota bacterium]